MTQVDNDNRVKQIAAGTGIVAVVALLVCGALVGWRYLPGLLGEWVGMMVGVMTTPFLLEASFLMLGVVVGLGLNYWHQRQDGEDWVDLQNTRFLPCTLAPPVDSMAAMSDELAAMNTVHFVKMAYGDVAWLRGLAVDFFRETRALIPQWTAMVAAADYPGLRVELHRCK